MKPDKKTILEEIESLRKEIEDLKERLYIVETYGDFTAGYIEKLLEAVGIQ